MIPIGFMAWRIGELLDPFEQLDWIATAGFEAVAFHAGPGLPGRWQGVDPVACTGAARERLRRSLARFRRIEIHAPFRPPLETATLDQFPGALLPALELAGDVGAAVVTAHCELPAAPSAAEHVAWDATLATLDAAADRCQTALGLELSHGFAACERWTYAHLGVTLDVGHVFMDRAGQTLAQAGGMAQLVPALGSHLLQLHVHDTDGVTDHIEPGTGRIDFAALCAALTAIGFAGGMSLELNPDLVSPAAICRSRTTLQGFLARSAT